MNVRVFARWEDDPLEATITLDAKLDASTRRIAGRWILFGAIGIGTADCRPFALDGEGRMDFGAGWGVADRIWRTDIRERELSLGALFEVMWSGGERGLYRIEKISTPGSKRGD